MISPLLPVNRNFSPRRVFPMNPDDARPVERQKRNKIPVEETSDGVPMEDPNGKCIRRYAILAEPIPRFPFNPPATNPFIAAIAINHGDSNIKH